MLCVRAFNQLTFINDNFEKCLQNYKKLVQMCILVCCLDVYIFGLVIFGVGGIGRRIVEQRENVPLNCCPFQLIIVHFICPGYKPLALLSYIVNVPTASTATI